MTSKVLLIESLAVTKVQDKQGQVKLADFGYSAQLTEERDARSSKVGTVCWMAPELIKGERRYDTKVDIWSFGIFAMELATGEITPLLSGRGAYQSIAISEDEKRVTFLSDRDDYGPEKPSMSLYHWAEGDDAAAKILEELGGPPRGDDARGRRRAAVGDLGHEVERAVEDGQVGRR